MLMVESKSLSCVEAAAIRADGLLAGICRHGS
jgi:hypothetical protein